MSLLVAFFLQEENNQLNNQIQTLFDQNANLVQKMMQTELANDKLKQTLDDLKQKTGFVYLLIWIFFQVFSLLNGHHAKFHVCTSIKSFVDLVAHVCFLVLNILMSHHVNST